MNAFTLLKGHPACEKSSNYPQFLFFMNLVQPGIKEGRFR